MAYIAVLDDAKPPTYANIALKAGISKQAVWKLALRYPGMLPWVNQVIAEQNGRYTSAVVQRMGVLGATGSREHAEVYLKWMSGFYSQGGGFAFPDDSDPVPGSLSGAHVTVNLLCPRPEVPQGAIAVPSKAVRLPRPDLPAVAQLSSR